MQYTLLGIYFQPHEIARHSREDKFKHEVIHLGQAETA